MTSQPTARPGSFVLSLLLSLSLVACGGGGDSSVVIPASYLPGQAEQGGWDVLQEARMRCNFGRVTRNAQLDAAALSHAKYLVDLSLATGDSTVSHLETPGLPGFTGVYPWDRTVYQGYSYMGVAEILEATVWEYTDPPNFPTMETRGADAMRNLLNTVYHLSGAMYEGSELGLGAYLGTRQISQTTWREEFRFGALNAYRSSHPRITMGAGEIATFPCEGSGGVPPAFEPENESPNPFIGTAYANAIVGPPIYLKADAPQELTVNPISSSISHNGISVPFTILNKDNDPNIDQINNRPFIGSHEVFVIPTSALMPDTRYQITLVGTLNNVPFNRSFAITTGL